jgi:light-regulated signal transduction histidine kinase (bacteriophytochrome)
MSLSAHVLPETADRTVALEAELRDFSYMVSHDLAASFRHVSEYSRLLTAELGGGLSPRQRSHVAYIQSAAMRCQAMMDGMLTFSQALQKAISPTRHDATLTMRLAMRNLANLDASGAEVTLSPLGEVFADAKLLTIAFGHLLENAIKFGRSGMMQTPGVCASATTGWASTSTRPSGRSRCFAASTPRTPSPAWARGLRSAGVSHGGMAATSALSTAPRAPASS